MLTYLYGSALGRVFLRFLCWPPLSRLAGRFLDSRFSRFLIPGFCRWNKISLEDFVEEDWPSFNAFFTRRLRPGRRPIDTSPQALVSPCDGLLRAYPIRDGMVLSVKDKPCTLPLLLGSQALAERYEGGLCLVFRLTPAHYHRYCYPDAGSTFCHRVLPGILHTVQPIATQAVPVYQLNCREYSLLRTENFGPVVFMEVGAMFVGRICNEESQTFVRGQEKGRFEFGGSTILLLLTAGQLQLRPDILETQQTGEELPVRLGEKLNL